METARGVALRLSRQVDDGAPVRATPAEHEELGKALVTAAPAMRRYYALVAIFGPFARGRPALAASTEAISRRLRALGEPLASRAEALGPGLRVVAVRD